MEDVRICVKCKGAMGLFVSKNNPASSEWYCEKCHYSEYVKDKPGTPARASVLPVR